MLVKMSTPFRIWNINTHNSDTKNLNMHKTVAEVTADKAFTKVRNKANNMHDNAESYA
jgi:hypothetical protein